VPLAMLLGDYLSATLRRLAALHARFAAGKLPAAPRARRPAAEGVAADRPRAERRPPGIPPGPVLLTVFRAGFDEMFRVLLDDPETRALLAASPQAGKLLRPLWRKLSSEPLPEALRLPPTPRRARQPRVRQPVAARPKAAPAAPEATGRAAWTYPVSLWSDPAPASAPKLPKPRYALPAWPKPLWPD
jgi:hypothetical protein